LVPDSRARLIELDAVERLAARDASLFVDPALAAERLGWVGLPAGAETRALEFALMAEAAVADGITDVVLLGMGGSSLAPLVLTSSLPPAPGYPRLHVLDTTSPRQTAALLEALTPATTWAIVSSKSGGSAEPRALAAVFGAWLTASLGDGAMSHMIAITDPDSPLTVLAQDQGYAATVLAPSDVGGRYSALSPFATLPAALTGIDIALLAATAGVMEDACARPTDDNPALALASWLADGLDDGRDKLHIVCSRQVDCFGLWAEQLVAESTGKSGRGILPVLETVPGLPDTHGPDAMTFVLRLEGDTGLSELSDRLPAGEPVFEVVIDDAYALAAEFIHWEWATALLCVAAGIECFGQPDVECSKTRTMAILHHEDPLPALATLETGVGLGASPGIVTDSLAQAVAGLLSLMPDRGYLAVLAFLPIDEAILAPLRDACTRVASALHIPVTLELGPRYLHSTGQYHKGGPAEGIFLAITVSDDVDLQVPDSPFTLGELHAAQAAGDVAALEATGMPVLEVALPSMGALADLTRAMTDAIRE
jgi:glucose-6-phosphate isomerase